jgi:hypothetical protein
LAFLVAAGEGCSEFTFDSFPLLFLACLRNLLFFFCPPTADFLVVLKSAIGSLLTTGIASPSSLKRVFLF